MKVAVITEDPTHDQYIIKPVVNRILNDLKKPKAKVEILSNSGPRGVDQALDVENIVRIIDRRPMFDLFLIVVDSDCEKGRQVALENCVMKAVEASGKAVIGCLAVEAIEIWALALHRDELPDPWSTVREDCHPKTDYYEPLAKRNGWLTGPGQGRVAAMKAISRQWRSLVGMCPELEKLRNNIKSWLEQQ